MQNLGAITLPESEGKFAKQIWEGEKSIKKNSVPSPSPRGRVNLRSKFGRGERSKNNFKILVFC
jgi:hypothetical protein